MEAGQRLWRGTAKGNMTGIRKLPRKRHRYTPKSLSKGEGLLWWDAEADLGLEHAELIHAAGTGGEQEDAIYGQLKNQMLGFTFDI